MYRSARTAITSVDDKATCYLGGPEHTIPIIALGPDAESFEITINSKLLTPAEQVAWLRRFAEQISDLADEINVRDLEDASTVSEYSCSRCGAQFGIAGVSSGSEEDLAADEYYASQVDLHESGACQKPSVV